MNVDVGTAHVVYASDDRFAEILGVSMVSLYENSRDMDAIAVYILDGGITNENRGKLLSVAAGYGRTEPKFIAIGNIVKFQMDVTTDRGSLIQYARLFISSVLSEDLERILYLDCDTVINRSVSELWGFDMRGKTVGALMDAFSRNYRRNIGLLPEDVMFNSGVMLIDMSRWRENRYEEKLLQFIQSYNGRIQQGDQGALNAILSHDVYCFEPRFNSVTIFYDFTYEDMLVYRKPPGFYAKEDIEKAIENPAIIHFTTSFLSRRPWMKESGHRYAGQWLKYREMSPWRDDVLQDDNRSAWRQFGSKFYSFMPRRIALHIAGILQAYIRPQINRILLKRRTDYK